MGRLDDLLAKAKGLQKEDVDLAKQTKILTAKTEMLKKKMIEIQDNAQMIELLGKYPLKGEFIPFYTYEKSHEEGPNTLSIVHEFIERDKPYIHFSVSDADSHKKLLDTRNSDDIRYLANTFPELTAENLEESLYSAIEKRLDEPSQEFF